MLTAKGDPVDRIIGLELGADDYVPKPCPPRELAARLNAILRRTANMPSAIAPVVAGPLTINPSRREATANGIVIDLTGTELMFVKVTARMSPVWALCSLKSQAMRVVSTRVLPEPAPARMSTLFSGAVTACSWRGLRD